MFFAAVGLLCGGILFFQGWRLDPILQFGQFLLAANHRLLRLRERAAPRRVTTEQARRSSYFDDEPAPNPVRRPSGHAVADWDLRDDVTTALTIPSPCGGGFAQAATMTATANGRKTTSTVPVAPARAAIPERSRHPVDDGKAK